MKFLADENFPRPALEALLKAGWDVVSIAEECPGVPDEDVAALCAAQERILLTFDKDFGELVFHRGLPAGSGVVLFRITPDSPEEAAEVAVAAGSVSTGSCRMVLRSHTRPDSDAPAQPAFWPLMSSLRLPDSELRRCQRPSHRGGLVLAKMRPSPFGVS